MHSLGPLLLWDAALPALPGLAFGVHSRLLFPPLHPGEDALTGDTDKYLRPQDLKELGDDSLPQEGYQGFSIGARSAR